MSNKNSEHQAENRYVDGYLNVVSVLLGVIALRTGVSREIDNVLKHWAENNQQETKGKSELDKSFQKGGEAAISQIRDLLSDFLDTAKPAKTAKGTGRFLVQTTPEEITANIVVTQVVLASLIHRLGLSDQLKEDLEHAQIAYGDIYSSQLDSTNAMTEQSPEIREAINRMQSLFEQYKKNNPA